MDEFLDYLASKGFLRKAGAGESRPDPGEAPAAPQPGEVRGPETRYHFANIPESFARKLFGPPALALYAGVVALALLAIWRDPSLVPGRDALYFTGNRIFKVLGFAVFVYGTLFIHEMAHLLAARAVGVKSRMGISHRLWFLVAETDLTGLWGVPRRQRYLPLLAGSLSDVVSLSTLFLLFGLQKRGLLAIHPDILDVLRAGCFMYFIRLVWQTYFYVRTDYYYVITTFFGCKNLLKDTEAFLKDKAGRWLPFVKRVDLSHIPAEEMRIVRIYSVIWLVGRCIAFSMLVFVSIPVLSKYVVELSRTLISTRVIVEFVDALVTLLVLVVPLAAGFVLWIRSLTQSWRRA
jgi:putative peptide zinc metalloprotease protein